MKIGLYFGSFNPIHIGHLVIANYFAEFTDLNQIWFVVSPHNPLKSKSTLLDDYHRLELVNLAIDEYSKFRVSNIEFHLSQPNYTVNTLAHLHEKYPDYLVFRLTLKSLSKFFEGAESYFRINLTSIDESNVSCQPYKSPKLIFTKCN